MVDLSKGGYATFDDFVGWLAPEEPPANTVRLLRSASVRVANACQRNLYTDTPSEADAAPLRDATCAQAAVWDELGITPDQIAGAAVAVKRSKILTADVENDTSAAAKRLDDAINNLAPEAEAILQAAGLLWHPSASGDPGVLAQYGLSGSHGSIPVEFANSTDAWPFL